MRTQLQKIVTGAALLSVLVILFLLTQKNEEKSASDELELMDDMIEEETSSIHNHQQDDSIVVDVKGEVAHTGVYQVSENDRVHDVIEQAGGFTDKAAKDYINLAERVHDAMVIDVPSVVDNDEVEVNHTGRTKDFNGNNEQKVNLNQATLEDLQSLPGIGPSKAEAILSYREENGRFQTEEEITEVSGIGEKTYESLKDLITVR